MAKPDPMNPESVMDLLKGNRFRFSLDGENYKDYLLEARRISEKILKRSAVNVERAIETIIEHFNEVSDP